jgi:hypothetical protein
MADQGFLDVPDCIQKCGPVFNLKPQLLGVADLFPEAGQAL